MVGSTQASRKLQTAQPQRRLQAHRDNTDTAMHAPSAQSYLVSDGSWVDCVPIEGQIAAHHPALKDHIIKMRPSVPPNARSSLGARSHPQLFAREHGGCPDGYIPVQRMDPNSPRLRKEHPPQAPGPAPVDVAVHEYAVTTMPVSSGAYSGSAAVLSVNGPTVANTREFSLSQLWIIDGSFKDTSLCTIEVGWQTYPGRHTGDADFAPHLFVYWTADHYNISGCYDLECPGFVQVENSWVIGGAMPSYTTLEQLNNGEIAEVDIQVLYDSTDLVWWLFLNGVAIGYWPAALYPSTYLHGTANFLEWGGEVAIEKNNTAHSRTVMGSGAVPTAGFPLSAYQRNITYADVVSGVTNMDANVKYLTEGQIRTDPSCYDIAVQLNNYANWGTYFFFGGPGGNNVFCKGTP